MNYIIPQTLEHKPFHAAVPGYLQVEFDSITIPKYEREARTELDGFGEIIPLAGKIQLKAVFL